MCVCVCVCVCVCRSCSIQGLVGVLGVRGVNDNGESSSVMQKRKEACGCFIEKKSGQRY